MLGTNMIFLSFNYENKYTDDAIVIYLNLCAIEF